MKRISLITFSLLFFFFMAKAQYTFEKSFSITFTNAIANQVAYISFPTNINIFGNIKVEISGGYGHQLNNGNLIKRFSLVKSASGYFNQLTEVTSANGPLAEQWHIGDFDPTSYQIPIYHLVSTGNVIIIKITGQLSHAASVQSIMANAAVSVPVQEVHGKTRQYTTIMADRVGIGTATPTEKLSVNGNIRAKEIKVETANWPDYVFEENYQMPSLSETETFIKQHRHLPGMPNKDQVAEDGVSLGEMNRKLLEKVEELTLLLIEKEKAEKEQNKRIERLEQDNIELRKHYLTEPKEN